MMILPDSSKNLIKIKTRPVVRCQICSMECSGTGARIHKALTGHNCWELLLPVEKKVVERTPNPYSLGVKNQQEVALASSAIVEHTQEG